MLSVQCGWLSGVVVMRHVIWGLLGVGAGCLVTMSVARSSVGERAGGAALPAAPASMPAAISQGAKMAIVPPAARKEADRRRESDVRDPRGGDMLWFRHRDEPREDPADDRGARPWRDFDSRRWRDGAWPRRADPPWHRRWTWRERNRNEDRWRRGEPRDWRGAPRWDRYARPPGMAEPRLRRRRPDGGPRPSPFMEPGVYWAGLPRPDGDVDRRASPVSARVGVGSAGNR